jgi:two-component system, LytTR family, sensor kinase
LDQIKSYIDLQKIRTDNPNYANFEIKGEVNDQKVAPMLFLPFIENAFKHCKNKTIENAIQIYFEIAKNKVHMKCLNYFEPNQIEILKSEGLGIETIKQRLNLLYADKHDLIISDKDNWFTVILNISLNNDN